MIKLCIPVTGQNMEEIKSQLAELALHEFDMIEWRADFYFSMEALAEIREAFPGKELLFTFRTKAEGGESQPETDDLMRLYELVGLSGKVDMIDLELKGICQTNPEILEKLKSSGIKLMISNHDFEKTPRKEEMIDRYIRMEALGADIGKIAVMPKSRDDVEILIAAAKKAGGLVKMPIVAISMGELGKRTRIEGETFGSVITFGCLGKASAPGQIPVKELIERINAL